MQDRLEIVPYQDWHADGFARLNREWLDKFGLYEEADGKHLYAPREHILGVGGDIFIAERGGCMIGTCALVPVAERVFELAKLAVSEDARGEGIGRLLTQRALDRACELSAARVVLLSSTKLGPALKLYESFGFVHRPLPSDQPYQTADVYMELVLGGAGVEESRQSL